MATTKKSTSRKRRSQSSQYIPSERAKQPIVWIAIIVLLVVYFFFFRDNGDSSKKGTIDNTTNSITSIKEIAEWEFLTLQLEEFVDTTVVKKLSPDQVAKIYTGNARLGIKMSKAKKGWIVCKENSVTISLPPIELLDKDMIDDTKTRTFYEDGKVSASVQEKMYQNAKRNMKAIALQKENIKMAEKNAESTFKSIFQSMGYKSVKVSFNN